MKAKQCLLYAKDSFKTVSDAWSHTVFILSYPVYYPKDYKPKSHSDEINELFNEFVNYGFLYKNEKDNWTFEKLSIEDGLSRIG